MGDLYLVLGGVSSGTRLVTRLLLAAGLKGNGNHQQEFDGDIEPGLGKIVWRRSYPHGKPGSADRWPNALQMVAKAEASGYKLKHIVVTHRDWYAASHSAARRRASIASVRHAMDFNRKAYGLIYRQLWLLQEQTGFTKYTMCSYDELVAYPELYSDWLIKAVGLKWAQTPEEIFNSNQKFYRGLKDEKK